MRGETVTVYRHTQIGVTPGNTPIKEWRSEVVEDVLVAPGPRHDLVESVRPVGVLIAWNLHFPKTFNKPLRGCEISVRGGPRLKVVGAPEPFTRENTPTRWHMPVELEGTDG